MNTTPRVNAALTTRPGRGENALTLPSIIANEGRRAATRFLEFFTANIRNPNTRLSYMRAVGQFLAWCEERGASLHQIEPIIVAAYIEQLTQERAPQTVKQHLAAIRMRAPPRAQTEETHTAEEQKYLDPDVYLG